MSSLTVTVLELLVGALLIYCAIWCRAFVPALAGQNRPGTHCTGSLVALTIAGASYLIAEIFGGALAGALGGLIARAGGRARGGKTSPRPTPTPTPTPVPGPALPGPGQAAAVTGASLGSSLTSHGAPITINLGY